MEKTVYSHAFLVGSFNGNVSPEILNSDNRWVKEVVSLNGEIKRYDGDKGYSGLCTLYYKAHLDAMLEAKDVKRPKILRPQKRIRTPNHPRSKIRRTRYRTQRKHSNESHH